MDQRWDKFENFLSDMGEAGEGKSIDRIKNNKGYSPDNCRWATKQEQMNNQTSNRFLQIGDETITLAEASRRYGVKSHTIAARIKRGFTIAEALTPHRLSPRY